MSAVKHTPVVIDLDGVTVMTDHKHGHHTICRSASPDSAAFIVQAVNSHYALIEALEDARTTISLTRTNIMCEIGRCADPSESRWAGVPELLKERLDRIDATLSLAKGEQA